MGGGALALEHLWIVAGAAAEGRPGFREPGQPGDAAETGMNSLPGAGIQAVL
jgi:hypothetical protein